MSTLARWTIAAMLAVAIAASPLLDGPTEYDAAIDTAAAVADLGDAP